MKNPLRSTFGVALLGLAAFGAHADDAPTHCSLATLNGTMVYTSVFAKNGAPRSTSGQESYDGKGHMKYFGYSSDGLTHSTFTGTATYTISADCVATVTYDYETVPWIYFVSADGSHYYWNNNQAAGAVASGSADLVSKALLVP